MTKQRLFNLNQLKSVSGCKVILVTPKNLKNYILKDHPLHKSYEYLSFTHKSDYLRTYFMRFYGEGYSDIKQTEKDWNESFEKIKNSNKWIIGYKEIKGGVDPKNEDLIDKYNDLLGNGAYICKPNTPFVIEWYNKMIEFLDQKYLDLKKNPAKSPKDRKEYGTGYPIEYTELLGRIFHKVCYKYKDKTLNTLPLPNFSYT